MRFLVQESHAGRGRAHQVRAFAVYPFITSSLQAKVEVEPEVTIESDGA